MKQLKTPNGDLITGVLEVVPGNALVFGFDEDLEPEYVDRIYLDDEGNEWKRDQLTVV